MVPFPFHKLPVELLIYIFELGEASSHLENYKNIHALEPSFSITVTHVCRLWRQVGIDAATLWVDIHIRNSCDLPFASLYLQRSVCLPVNITCVWSQQDGLYCAKMSIMHILLPSAQRWRKITITTGHWMLNILVIPFTTMLRGLSVPNLHTFELGVITPLDSIIYSFSSIHPEIFSGGAPNLRVARIMGFPCCSITAFSNITSLTFNMSNTSVKTPHELCDMLIITSKSLIYLRLGGPSHFETVSYQVDELQKIDFPNMEVLEISSCPLPFCIDAPKLEKLALQSLSEELTEAVLNKSHYPSLRYLTLVKMRLLALDRHPDFFTNLPHLVSLDLHYCHSERTMLGLLRLDLSGGSNIPAPNFCSLTICDEQNWMMVQSILTDRIARGCRTVSRVSVEELNFYLPHIKTWLGAQNIQCEVIEDKVSCPVFDCATDEGDWQNQIDQFVEQAWLSDTDDEFDFDLDIDGDWYDTDYSW